MGQSHPMYLLYHGSVVKVVILMREVESLPTAVVVCIVLLRTMRDSLHPLLFTLSVLRFSFSSPVSISVAHVSIVSGWGAVVKAQSPDSSCSSVSKPWPTTASYPASDKPDVSSSCSSRVSMGRQTSSGFILPGLSHSKYPSSSTVMMNGLPVHQHRRMMVRALVKLCGRISGVGSFIALIRKEMWRVSPPHLRT